MSYDTIGLERVYYIRYTKVSTAVLQCVELKRGLFKMLIINLCYM
jgi:hypothetical protein